MRRTAAQASAVIAAGVLMGLAANAVHPKGVVLWKPLPKRALTDPRFVTLQTAMDLHRAGRVAFVDARPAERFAERRIEGALSLPADAFERSYPKISELVPKDYEVLVYCDSDRCTLAEQVADRLRALGYTRVRVFEGGLEEWRGPTEP